MLTFKKTFELAEQDVRPKIEKLGFTLEKISITEESDSQWVFGLAQYTKIRNCHRLFQKKRFIRLSTAPLRLELDLFLGEGNRSYSISELHELEGNEKFPERTHDLYEAVYDKNQLQSEFERLIKVLMACGSRFFSDDSTLWDDLDKQRARHDEESVNQQIFKDAEMAFKKQDWAKVVKLLEDKQQILSRLNSARLSYAKKKLTNI